MALGGVALGLMVIAVGAVMSLQAGRLARVSATPELPAQAVSEPLQREAQFGDHAPPAQTRRVANWAVATDNRSRLPFMVIDKKLSLLHVFDREGVRVGATPVLLGQALGDHSVPGIGDREVSQVRPFERTTPAGRFATQAGRNLAGEDIVWIDYGAAVSLHRVRATVPRERRLQRLASSSAADNRVSYGCINVPVEFYNAVVHPLFSGTSGLAYVLPEVDALHETFKGLPASDLP